MGKGLILIIFVTLLMSGCKTFQGSKKTEFPADSTLEFQNIPFTSKDRKYKNTSILRLFNIQQDSVEKVRISIRNKLVTLSFIKNKEIYTFQYEGKFTSFNDFQVYLQNQRTEIPPFLPLFYSSIAVNRLRISINEHGQLKIKNKINYSAHFLLMAVGHRSNYSYYFYPSSFGKSLK